MIDAKEAILILRKWSNEQTLIVCQGKFRDAAFALTGVVASLSDSKCQVNSRKGEAKLEFIFDAADCVFEYVERRAGMAADADEEFAEKASLLIFFPPRFSLAEFRTETTEGRDTLAISELHPSELRGR
jgi:hypothetical protein